MMAQISAAKGSTSKPPGKGIGKVTWQKLRDNALKKTEFYDISRQSNLLPELRTEYAVHPQLETVDFYKGGQIPHIDYIPQTLRLYHERKNEHEIEYRKDVTLEGILENFKEGQISFVGQAGSGKTTLLKAITRQVIGGKYKNLSSIEVVHFVHLRTFKRNDLVTPAELLFRNVTPEMSDAEMEEAMQHAKENPDKALFIIDSLDTVPYTIDGVYTGIPTVDDRASPEAILFHLLSGNLLPGCRFITSSREYAIRNYKGDIQAKQVIALVGLAKDSMRKVVVGYVGEEKAEERMTYLKRKPVIESLCATPVWLIFTLMVLSIESTFTPTTIAGILVVLLQNMIRSEHMHEGTIEIVVCKLGKMAFTGTKEHRVEFLLDELGNFKLSENEIRDLMVVTPSGDQKLLLGDSIIMYTHQCLQEILTAFHITKMNLKEFKQFISMYIHEPHYAVVRRLLAGIILNCEVFEKAENFLEDAADFEQKRLCLRNSLEKQLNRHLSKHARLELYTCLSECGDGAKDIIWNKVEQFDFSKMTLSPSEMYSIGRVMSPKTFIKVLQLNRCNLTQTSLSALYHALEDGNVELHELDVSYNEGLGPDEMTLIAKIFVKRKVKVLRLSGCQPKSGALKAFLDSSVGAELHELDISYNERLGPDEMALIARILVQCKVKVSRLRKCQPKSDALKAFLDSSVGAKLQEFDISWNKTLGPDEMALIAKIFVQFELKVLGLWGCEPKLNSLKAFLDSSIGLKLHEFDISYNNTLGPDEMALVAKIFVQCNVKVLKLGLCEPKSDGLKAFLDSSVGAKLDELDVSGNTFGPDEMMVVAQICKQRQVDRFRVRDCKLPSGALKSFLFHSVGAKISLLDIGVIRLDMHERTLLGKIIRQCGVETLVAWKSEALDSIDVESFKLRSDNFKISKLQYGEDDVHFEIHDSEDSLGYSVSKLLPYVAKEVILINYDASTRIVEILQNRLDEGKNKDMRIMFKGCSWHESEGDEVDGTFEHKLLQCKEPSSEIVPSIVENRRAELNNDGSITVSWHYPDEDPDVRYHMEMLCNDQPTGDIKICKDPQYECKTLCPLQVYCFRIWVVDSNGLAGIAMFTNEVLNRRLVISESLHKEVGSSGDHLTVGGCAAVFPRNSFKVSTPVALIAEIDSAKWPKDFLALTPTLYVNAQGLQERVCIKLPSWGAINEQNISTVRILHLPTGSNEWEDTGIALSFTNSSFLEFEWHDFSPVLGAIRSQNKALDYLISGSIFTSEFNELSIAFYVNSDLVFKSVSELMASENPSKHRKLCISPFSATLGETVETAMICHDPGFFLEPPGPFAFTVKNYFADAPEIHYTAMCSDWQAEKRVNLKGEIKKNGNQIEPGSFGFADMWKPKESQQKYRANDRMREEVGSHDTYHPQGRRRDEASTSSRTERYDQVPHAVRTRGHEMQDNSDPALHLAKGTKRNYKEPTLYVEKRRRPTFPSDIPGSFHQAVHQQCRADDQVREEVGSHDRSYHQRSRQDEASTSTQIGHFDQVPYDTRGSINPAFLSTPSRNETLSALMPQLPHSVTEPTDAQIAHARLAVAEIHPRQYSNSLNFDQPSTSRRVPPNTGGILISRQSKQYYYDGSSYEEYRQMDMGFQGFANATGSQPFRLGMETASRAIVGVEEARRQAPPPEIAEPRLALEEAKIRLSWDKIDRDRVTYCVNIYCNNQLINDTPMKTPNTEIEYARLKPSCKYLCEVWTCNSCGVESGKTWSNAVNTPDTQECSPPEDEARRGGMLSLDHSQGASVTFKNSTIILGGSQGWPGNEEGKEED